MGTKLNKLNFKASKSAIVTALAITAVVALPELASAGDGGTEFAVAEERIVGMIGGTGGKLVAAISLGLAAIGSMIKFNPIAVGSALGVGILASTGVAAVQTGITAII